MTYIELDMIQTAGIGALALIVGMILTRRISFLQRFCVPSPVSGGIIFSLLTLLLYGCFDIEVSFDGTLKDIFMLAFFTCVGYQSDLKVNSSGHGTFILTVNGVQVQSATSGQTVTIVPKPATGFHVSAVSVVRTDNGEFIPVTNNTFVMPYAPVRITVDFAAN